MAIYYRTKAGETLDLICWNYYVKEISLGAAAMSIDPRLALDTSAFDNGFFLNSQREQDVRGTVEKVLEVNPGLAAYPLELPAGLTILLPDVSQELKSDDSVKLWD